MPELMRCPHGHVWQPDTPRHGDTLQIDLACPVCGTLVATQPSYLREALESTDALCNSPAREAGMSKATALRAWKFP